MYFAHENLESGVNYDNYIHPPIHPYFRSASSFIHSSTIYSSTISFLPSSIIFIVVCMIRWPCTSRTSRGLVPCCLCTGVRLIGSRVIIIKYVNKQFKTTVLDSLTYHRNQLRLHNCDSFDTCAHRPFCSRLSFDLYVYRVSIFASALFLIQPVE